MRTACFVGAVWLILFVLLIVATPEHYVSDTVTAGKHIISSSTTRGSLNALLSSALRAFYITALISVVAVGVGCVAVGVKPFFIRIGLMRSPQSA